VQLTHSLISVAHPVLTIYNSRQKRLNSQLLGDHTNKVNLRHLR